MLAEWAPIYDAMAVDLGPGRRRGFSPVEVDEMELWQIVRFLNPPDLAAEVGPGGIRRVSRQQHAAASLDLINKRIAADRARKAAIAAGVAPDAAAQIAPPPTLPAMVATDEQVAALRARRQGR